MLPPQDQEVVLSTTGGTVTSWRYKGKDIFYPQQTVLVGGVPKLRGGMHPCFPNFGEVNSAFGLPPHGSLRTMRGERLHENLIRFESDELFGVEKVRCNVMVGLEWLERSFSYKLYARLMNAPGKVPVNPGFHPYFSTPEGRATIFGSGKKLLEVSGDTFKEIVPLNSRIIVVLPGVGAVDMNPLDHFTNAAYARLVVWRDRADYLCVEPILAEPALYGTLGPHLHPGEAMKLGCSFHLLGS